MLIRPLTGRGLEVRIGGLFRMRYRVYVDGVFIGNMKYLAELPDFVKSHGL